MRDVGDAPFQRLDEAPALVRTAARSFLEGRVVKGHWQRTSWLVVAAVVLAAQALSACGGDDICLECPEESSSESTAAPSPGVDGDGD